VRPTVAFLEEMIRSNHIQKIITTGPPHSIHLIGLKLKRRNPAIKWIADFRDPWSQWDLLDTLGLSSWARKRHAYLERTVLQQADRVITIAPFHVALFEKLGGRKVDLITNGFDTEDFSQIKKERTEFFVLRHIGIVDELRDPRPVMEAIRLLGKRVPKLKVEFIGNVNANFREWVAQDESLAAVTRFIPYVPHSELLSIYGQTDLQILVLAHTAIAPGNLPGKFFEYLASKNPILAIGPVQGDAADVLRETKAGEIFERTDTEGMATFISSEYLSWEQGTPSQRGRVELYSRKNLTDKLIDLMNQL